MTTRIAAAALLAAVLPACTTTTETFSDFTAPGKHADAALEDVVNGDKPPTAKSLHAAARICKSQGRDASSEILFNRLLNQFPDYMPAYNELAELYVRNDMIDSAIQTLRTGLAHAPDDTVLLNNLGMCHLLKRQYGSAVDSFTEATAHQPVNARNRANLAVGLALMGRAEEAYALFLQVLPSREAHHNMGVLFQSIGNEDMAQMHFALART